MKKAQESYIIYAPNENAAETNFEYKPLDYSLYNRLFIIQLNLGGVFVEKHIFLTQTLKLGQLSYQKGNNLRVKGMITVLGTKVSIKSFVGYK